MQNSGRVNFGSKIGAILAAAGSAVGLGNIWRFPYEAGNHGGAAFILIYFPSVFNRFRSKINVFLHFLRQKALPASAADFHPLLPANYAAAL